MFDDVGNIENCTIFRWVGDIIRVEEMTTSMTASFGFTEVTGIDVYGQNHVAFGVCKDGFVLRGKVVEELFSLL